MFDPWLGSEDTRPWLGPPEEIPCVFSLYLSSYLETVSLSGLLKMQQSTSSGRRRVPSSAHSESLWLVADIRLCLRRFLACAYDVRDGKHPRGPDAVDNGFRHPRAVSPNRASSRVPRVKQIWHRVELYQDTPTSGTHTRPESRCTATSSSRAMPQSMGAGKARARRWTCRPRARGESRLVPMDT
ncbi:hypothetical protein VTK73DRAFT_1873 [Phialemonium thermophilum]|uniref:Uncharacterized protein n=1 Tax=Phialemonium thermophilum TaxID=223376 RepID=A0ABR3VSW4_9PEZI